MARTKKPIPVGKSLLPLAQHGAKLWIIDQQPRIIIGSKHLLVNGDVLTVLREAELIQPFTKLNTQDETLVTTISLKGKSVAEWMIEQAKNYKQLEFDDFEYVEGMGNALTSKIV